MVDESSPKNEFSYLVRPTAVSSIEDADKLNQGTRDDNLSQLIAKARETIQRLQENARIDEKAWLAAELAKLSSPKAVEIPGQSTTYYTLHDDAGGVTEKTCLMDEATFRQSLQGLANAQDVSDVKAHKLRMNAILKHPKKDRLSGNLMPTEVQREALGLEIADILGFTVTDRTVVLHETSRGKEPCLFVPFGQMELLKEGWIEEAHQEANNPRPNDPQSNAKGSSHARLKSEHHSAVEDFGKYATFFMLCSDTDFIGKQGQNKGLYGEESPKKLYIFDQVFMSERNFAFDRALNLIPTNRLSKMPEDLAKHFMGRNKSVVNDASYEEKVAGMVALFQKKEAIEHMFVRAAKANQGENDATASALQEDAKLCHRAFTRRLTGLRKLLPEIKLEGKTIQPERLTSDTARLTQKAMLVNSLLNKPRLFDKTGQPYRAPHITQVHTRVKKVHIEGDQVTLTLARSFGRPISEAKKVLLEAQGFTVSANGKTASISKEALKEFNEQRFFKVTAKEIDLNHNYLSPEALTPLSSNYQPSLDTSLRVSEILDSVQHPKNTMEAIFQAIEQLEDLQEDCDQDCLQHVKRCFQCELVKRIMEVNPQQRIKIASEFEHAQANNQLDNFVSTLSERASLAADPAIAHAEVLKELLEQTKHVMSNASTDKAASEPSNQSGSSVDPGIAHAQALKELLQQTQHVVNNASTDKAASKSSNQSGSSFESFRSSSK